MYRYGKRENKGGNRLILVHLEEWMLNWHIGVYVPGYRNFSSRHWKTFASTLETRPCLMNTCRPSVDRYLRRLLITVSL